ncbi:hypothetical protein EVA_11959 [gut metagenome]|uniref:Uncharacterized protein n=1 Tax=gut metagenome TaxID=749906 RepID=J9CIN6_9ZZZZ
MNHRLSFWGACGWSNLLDGLPYFQATGAASDGFSIRRSHSTRINAPVSDCSGR